RSVLARGLRSFAASLRDQLAIPGSEAEDDALTKRNRISLLHRGADGRTYPLEFENESDGTQRLLHLAPALWPWGRGDHDLLVVDELDRSLHPTVALHFIREFKRRRPTGQLIFTTHSTHLLDHDALEP